MPDINKTYRNLNRQLTGLCTFDLVSRSGSFTKTADVLGITQSAVSQRIHDLETELGVTLFNREHRGVSLNHEGIRLMAAVEPAISQLGDIVSVFQQRKSKQRVRLSLDFAFASFWLLPRLPNMRDELKEDIDIQILTSQTPVDAGEGACDMIVHMCRAQSMVESDVLLFPERTIAVCSPAFLAHNGPFHSAADLLGVQLLSLSAPQGANWHTWQSWFTALDITGSRAREYTSFSNYDLVMQAAISGQGVALGWSGLIDRSLESGVLVQATTDIVSSDIGYVLTRNRKSSNLGGPKKVFNWIAANAGMSETGQS